MRFCFIVVFVFLSIIANCQITVKSVDYYKGIIREESLDSVLGDYTHTFLSNTVKKLRPPDSGFYDDGLVLKLFIIHDNKVIDNVMLRSRGVAKLDNSISNLQDIIINQLLLYSKTKPQTIYLVYVPVRLKCYNSEIDVNKRDTVLLSYDSVSHCNLFTVWKYRNFNME